MGRQNMQTQINSASQPDSRTILIQFIEDLESILDSAQLDWLAANKGYYICKAKQAEVAKDQCRRQSNGPSKL